MMIPADSFYLSPGASGTLQQKIRQMVTDGILAGRLRPGDRMPSSRGLALHLGVSRITVTLAYSDLMSSDYLSARGRSGYFVSDTAPRPPDIAAGSPVPDDLVDFESLTGRRFSRLTRIEKPQDWQDYPYCFIYGQPDPTLFDHQNWRLCALRALGKRDFGTLTMDAFEQDDPLLVETILRTILPRRGIAARPDQVLLTMGAQNALWLAAQVLLAPGRRAVIEDPGYPGLRGILEQAGAAISAVPVDDAGLAPEALPATDVVFTTASHHCPTNATMPLARREALLAAASAQDFLIVEDDYEFEMSFLKPASPSLKSLDREGRVIYAGSFSKSLFPGIRLGYLVGPAAFIREARALRATVLRHPPGHIQRTVAYFLSLGHYDALINRMKAAYRRRRLIMEDAIRAHGLTVAGQGGFGGSSFWMRAPEGVDTGVLALQLRGQGVLIEPGCVFFAGGGQRNFYRLAYSSIAPQKIAEGMARIARSIVGPAQS
jgi:GntR family transcriptional regulator / MocR family aminotransferase